MSQFEEDTRGPRKPQKWTVVHSRIAVRDSPSVKGRLVGTRKKGDELVVLRARDGWVQLSEKEHVLIDGTELGFGVLVERVDCPMTLKVINPADGSPYMDLAVRTSTTVRECRERVGAHVAPNGGQLRWQSIVPARGKMGQRIIDSKYNMFEDGMTMADCDLDDGDEFGFAYLGSAHEDLKMPPP